ncbi:MAG TPA: M48 family metallopeptidase [Chloroflexota bacterium]|jgi:Zn-dependent protease with chaperone function|nr:M48 family metallopeptidase [Chloroflexota bacterium]
MAQSFADFVKTRKRPGEDSSPDTTTLYAHPTDSTVQKFLARNGLQGSVETVVNAYLRVAFGTFLHDSVQVSPRQFPELYAVLNECAERLSIPIPRLLIGPDKGGMGMNAFTFGTDDQCFIFVTSFLALQMAVDELRFVIGHECGHIHNRHVTFLTLAYMLHYRLFTKFWLDPIKYKFPMLATKIPLDTWQRRAEVTADRAGAICAGDVEAGARALIKLRLGFSSLAEQVDVDAYLRQGDALRERTFAERGQEMTYAHPLIVKRIKMLRLFGRSELFYTCAGLPRPEGLDTLQRIELERATEEVVKVL